MSGGPPPDRSSEASLVDEQGRHACYGCGWAGDDEHQQPVRRLQRIVATTSIRTHPRGPPWPQGPIARWSLERQSQHAAARRPLSLAMSEAPVIRTGSCTVQI